MNYAYLPTAFVWIITLYMMYYFHEGGHYLAIKSLNLKVTKVYFRRLFLIPIPHAVESEGEIESKKRSVIIGKMLFIVLSGPVVGLIPIIMAHAFYPDLMNLVLFLLVYLYGCKEDAAKSYKLIRNDKIAGLEISEK